MNKLLLALLLPAFGLGLAAQDAPKKEKAACCAKDKACCTKDKAACKDKTACTQDKASKETKSSDKAKK